MRRIGREHEEEPFVLVPSDEVDRFVCKDIGEVFLDLHLFESVVYGVPSRTPGWSVSCGPGFDAFLACVDVC